MRAQPYIIDQNQNLTKPDALFKRHVEFDEAYIQKLIANHPAILPVSDFRYDVGQLLAVGREVFTQSGAIDNLFLSTNGYVVIVETKLWRNPESRRQVISQILDYVKDIATKSFEWIEEIWNQQTNQPLTQAISELEGEEINEAEFVDRVNASLNRGDVISLIVGDGINTQLEELVTHLTRDSANLRYTLGMVSITCYRMPNQADLLVIPEIVNEVQPVERAYVRVELDEQLAGNVNVKSVAKETTQKFQTKRRPSLTEDELFRSLKQELTKEEWSKVEEFFNEVEQLGIHLDFKSSSVMLKITDPEEAKNDASILGIEKGGKIYNSLHCFNQADRWGWSQEAIERTFGQFHKNLGNLDPRFLKRGMVQTRTRQMPPLKDIIQHLPAIKEEIRTTLQRVQQEIE